MYQLRTNRFVQLQIRASILYVNFFFIYVSKYLVEHRGRVGKNVYISEREVTVLIL